MKINYYQWMLLVTAGAIGLNTWASINPANSHGQMKGLKTHTNEKRENLQLGGSIQWDYYSDHQPDKSGSKQDSNGFDVRRARVGLNGHVDRWAYKTTFAIEQGGGIKGVDIVEMYLRYSGIGPHALITIGKQKEAFGLEALTSSKDVSSLERSAMTEFYASVPSTGIQFHGHGDSWTYAMGVFEPSSGSYHIIQKAITGRATKAYRVNNAFLVHLGAGFTIRDRASVNGDIQRHNIELAILHGALHIQGEYFKSEENNEDFSGYYLQFGYVFKGYRPYQAGIFKRVKPESNQGTWELVARHEEGDGKFNDIGLDSGFGQQITLGINYYWKKYVRLGLSYMDGELKSVGVGSELRFRTQLVF